MDPYVRSARLTDKYRAFRFTFHSLPIRAYAFPLGGLSWGLFSAETGGAGFQAARSISMSVSIQALNVGDIFLSFASSSRLMPCLVYL